jgi:lysozyme
MNYDLSPLITYLDAVETCVSPARHLPADAPDVITGGYGETDPRLIYDGMIVPVALAGVWRDNALASIQASILGHANHVITQGQMIALLDFSYNVGIGALLGSTLWSFLQIGDVADALNEFKRWDIANGKELVGLEKRRFVEMGWFSSTEIPAA